MAQELWRGAPDSGRATVYIPRKLLGSHGSFWERGLGTGSRGCWEPLGEGASNVRQRLWAFIVGAVRSKYWIPSREALFRSLGKGGGDFRERQG